VCNQTISLTDCLATFAELVSMPLGDTAGEDSFSFLPLLENPNAPFQRAPVIMHSIAGFFAIRDGDWKLLECRGSGGWSLPENKVPKDAPPKQLYNLKDDIGEQKNLLQEYPDIVERLQERLEKIRNSERSH